MPGAGDGIRTRDIDLGKVALYQLSYSRPSKESSFSLTNISAVKRYRYIIELKRFINLRQSSSAVLDYFSVDRQASATDFRVLSFETPRYWFSYAARNDPANFWKSCGKRAGFVCKK